MKRAAFGGALALLTAASGGHAQTVAEAEPTSAPVRCYDRVVPLWSGEHALALPAHRLEVGLFGASHYGFGAFEVSLHPLLLFALPHVELKGQVGSWHDRYATALRARVSYPTLLLDLVSREGAGGLLPKTSSPPTALLLEGDFLFTSVLHGTFRGPALLLTVSLGGAAAPHGSFSPTELPLLDFPFLYPRFAALYTSFVPRFFIGVEGPLWRERLVYSASLRYFLMPDLPDAGAASALEPSVALEYRFNDHVAVSAELKSSLADYAYGTRLHLLPYADVRVGF